MWLDFNLSFQVFRYEMRLDLNVLTMCLDLNTSIHLFRYEMHLDLNV
jgi:hypothetical protein